MAAPMQVAELSLEDKKRFLKFFTGSDRSPIGGLGSLRCIIQVRWLVGRSHSTGW